MIFAIVITVYILIILFDFVPSIKKDEKKVIWIYAVVMIISFSVITLRVFNVSMPCFTSILNNIIAKIV